MEVQELSLRDYFAGMAMSALIARGDYTLTIDTAEHAYDLANDMIEAKWKDNDRRHPRNV